MKHFNANIKFFIFALVCAFAAAACSNNPANVKNSNAPNKPKDTATIPANAPPGAQPPNMLGAANATVSIEEFADFQCPTCASVYPMMKSALSTYGSRVKFVYHEFPLPMHKNGYDAAVAAEAAGQQGKFWDMQNQLFTNQKSWADSNDARTIFEGYAEKIGLDVEKFKTDSLSLATKQRVDSDLARGRALNVNSTPTIYINGKALPFEQLASVDTLRAAIDSELAKGGTAPTAAPAAANNQAANSQPTNNSAANQTANAPVINK